jgi:hypothetical protein
MWSDFYAAGGWGMYPVTLFGFLLLAASLLYTLRPAEKNARIALLLGVLTFSAGLLGTAVGVCTSAHYIPQVPLDKQLQTLALGCEESLHNLVLALILVILAGILTAAGMLRRSAGLTSPAKSSD